MKENTIDKVIIAFVAIFLIIITFLYIEYRQLIDSYTLYHEQILMHEDISLQSKQMMRQTLQEIEQSSIAKVAMAFCAFTILFIGYKREKKISKELQQFKNFVNKAAIVSKTDANGVITEVNNAFVKLSKYSKNELIGQPHSIIRHPDTPPEYFEGIWKRLKDGKPWAGKLKNRAKDGSEYIISGYIFPVFSSVF
ncbi:MAG: PAS domain-containing protein, partial [Campylobacterota bacterium]